MNTLYFSSKKILLVICLIMIAVSVRGQVGIGTDTPNANAILDITSADRGVLIPRVGLSATSSANPMASHVAGMLVYNTATTGDVTPGFYYNSGTAWVRIVGGEIPDAWLLEGNAAGANDFLGTTNNQNLLIKTNNADRFSFTTNGRLRSYGKGTAGEPTFAWTGNGGTNTGMYSPTDNVLGFSTSGTERFRIDANGRIMANTTTPSSALMTLEVGSVPALFTYSGDSYGIETTSNGTGLNAGIWSDAINQGFGGIFTTVNSLGNPSTSSAAGLAVMQGYTVNTLTTGAAIYATGTRTGIYSVATNNGTGSGNSGNSSGLFVLGTGVNQRARAQLAGYERGAIAGQGNASSNNFYGGYFEGGNGTAYAYVGTKQGTNAAGTTGTNYKIIGNGSVSTLVDDQEGNKRILFAPEAPEILFEDYGTGVLENGKTYIQIDPVFSKAIHVSEKHPLKVFIQLEGECNGVYVTDKSAAGFRVVELNNGVSNTPFSYHIVANRADDIAEDGSIASKHVGLRFPVGPQPLPKIETTTQTLEKDQKTPDKTVLQKQEAVQNVKKIERNKTKSNASVKLQENNPVEADKQVEFKKNDN